MNKGLEIMIFITLWLIIGVLGYLALFERLGEPESCVCLVCKCGEGDTK